MFLQFVLVELHLQQFKRMFGSLHLASTTADSATAKCPYLCTLIKTTCSNSMLILLDPI